MENEFNIQALRDSLRTSTVHIYSKDEHVGFIEKEIGEVKEITWLMFHYAP